MTRTRGSEPGQAGTNRGDETSRVFPAVDSQDPQSTGQESMAPKASAYGQPPWAPRGGSLPKMISVRPLKELVLSKFPDDHPLREVILAEKDHIAAEEFVVKMEVWAVLVSRRT